MVEEIISVRLDKSLRERMKTQVHLNWSAIIRKSIQEYLENERVFDLEKARNASKEIDKLRESNSFNKGNKKGVEIIREWRSKRRL